jgi:hypothetical protein
MDAGAGSARGSRSPREGMEVEEDLDDKALLGEATLAKLGGRPAAEDDAVVTETEE